MSEFLCYKDKKKGLKIDTSCIGSKEIKLINLRCAVKTGYTDLIAKFVRNAFDEGLSADDMMGVVSGLILDGPSLASLTEFLRALRYEENNRQETISVFDEEWRED